MNLLEHYISDDYKLTKSTEDLKWITKPHKS